ncbi:MAG: TolC family protein [Bacteroidetes bacterium]|nr:TolC family protein [Bacteroidota bacterium]HET6243723.1 TolC family protein [Bacteroidia bacterium]
MHYLKFSIFSTLNIRSLKFKILFGIALLTYAIKAEAQSNMDTLLYNIAENNLTIAANRQYLDAEKLHFKTGLSLYNPDINYDYMIGSPSTAGNQTDFTISQAFDFPTAYIKRKKVSELQIQNTEFQFIETQQNVLLEAKAICIELIYRNKLHLELLKRKENSENLLNYYKTRLKKGDGTVLEVNKVQLQGIEINKNFQQNLSFINQLNQKLTALNGGKQIVFTDTLYPLLPPIPGFEQLEDEIEKNDPKRKFLELEKLIGQKQLELSKALALPKMETGYHYQGILGQKFQGVHFGITIPIWENKNTVKTQQARLIFKELLVQEHRNEHYHEIKQLYENYKNLEITLKEYQTFFLTLNNTDLLNKALAFGQISTIEYFLELSYYNNSFDEYLKTEKEYHQVLVQLFKFRL